MFNKNPNNLSDREKTNFSTVYTSLGKIILIVVFCCIVFSLIVLLLTNLNIKKNNIYGATSDVINYISWFNRQLANPRFALSWKTCLKYSIKNYLFIIKNNPNFSDNKDEINIKLKTQYKQIAKLEDALILMEELYFYITRSLSGNKSLKYEKHIGKITKRMVDFYLCIEQEMQKCISAFHFEKFIELDINWFDDSRK